MDPALIGVALTLLGLGASGFWAVWTRMSDALEKERLAREELAKELRQALTSGAREDALRDQALVALREGMARIEALLTAELRAVTARLDRLAGKVEDHMAGEVKQFEAVLEKWVNRNLP
jgi:Tfp pilus assembly protein PilO